MNSIEKFLAARTYAVAGASNRSHKYGNKVFRALLAAGRETYPLNPAEDEIEGHQAYPSILVLPLVPDSLSIITPPVVTRKIVADAIAAGSSAAVMMNGKRSAIASLSRSGCSDCLGRRC